MIKYELMFMAGVFLERKTMRPLNELVRLSYLKFLTPLLAFYLGHRRKKISLSLVPRHSAVSGKKFNFLFSDLDFSVILHEPPTKENLNAIRDLYYGLKPFFPFLGELEIFTQQEHLRFGHLLDQHQQFYGLIRDLRKLHWIIEDKHRFRSRYHEYKNLSALSKLCFGYKKDIPPDVANVLKEIGKKIEAKLESLKMDAKIEDIYNLDKSDHLSWHPIDDLQMNPRRAWVLSAILPDQFNQVENATLRKIRKDSRVNFLRRDYAETESLQIMAVFRARPEEFPWMESWAKDLKRQVLLSSELEMQ